MLNQFESVTKSRVQAKAIQAFPLKGLQMIAASCLLLAMLLASQTVLASGVADLTFRRIPTQFIAALGDPKASEGNGAETWGLWPKDPGPRGVWLNNYEQQLVATGGTAPLSWKFDDDDWWLDENGLIMEKPEFPMPPGKYLVTGDRETVTVLTVHPEDESGNRRWELANGAVLFDVTHMPCRSARYTPVAAETSCTPASASMGWFPVQPGGVMPTVAGCHKQDYSVLFIIAVEVGNQG